VYGKKNIALQMNIEKWRKNNEFEQSSKVNTVYQDCVILFMKLLKKANGGFEEWFLSIFISSEDAIGLEKIKLFTS
jgi:hypothetical protein